uniref:Uncharacterized protein n=1 Tax=Ditylenchus dipsaci TaxID=166011 RepID=A0A915DQU7_9BILA
MSSKAYLIYLNFGENVIALGCQITSIYLFFYLMYCAVHRPKKLKVASISLSMRLYIWSQIIGCASLLPYQIYMIFQWRGSKIF